MLRPYKATMTVSVTTLSIMVLRITTLIEMVFSMTTLRITTVSIRTLSIITILITFGMTVKGGTVYFINKIVGIAINLSVFRLNVVAPRKCFRNCKQV